MDDVESALDCQRLCQLRPGCQYFLYQASEQQCWLKKDGGIKVSGPGFTFGPRTCPRNTLFEYFYLWFLPSKLDIITHNPFILMKCSEHIKNTVSENCFENGVDSKGHDISSFAVTNILHCKEECQKIFNCKLFVYSPSQNFCWLKHSANMRSMNDDRILGPRVCTSNLYLL